MQTSRHTDSQQIEGKSKSLCKLCVLLLQGISEGISGCIMCASFAERDRERERQLNYATHLLDTVCLSVCLCMCVWVCVSLLCVCVAEILLLQQQHLPLANLINQIMIPLTLYLLLLLPQLTVVAALNEFCCQLLLLFFARHMLSTRWLRRHRLWLQLMPVDDGQVDLMR